MSGTVSICKNEKIERVNATSENLSIGHIYSGVTTRCGFRVGKHEGKITGLAAYGDGGKMKDHFNKLFYVENGEIKNYGLVISPYQNKFCNPKKDLMKNITKIIKWNLYRKIQKKLNGRISDRFSETEFYFFDQKFTNKDLSAGVQEFSEEIIVKWISHWVKKTGLKKLALAGGFFANVKVNQRIMEKCGIDELFIYPNMGDGGLAIGCAYLSYFKNNKYTKDIGKTDTMYLGTEYSDSEILSYLKKDEKVIYEKSKDIASDTAKLVADRKIIGWFQGKIEFGPRALGSRSVVAMPDDPSINDWLNKRMQRTEFMPFAPSVLGEHMDDIFVIPSDKFKKPAEYMTITYDVKKKWQGKIGVVNHIDNTARPQMVTKKTNPLYYKMISKVYELTGLPMTINTSFNVHEEPIVMTPYDGLNALHRGMVDVLAIGNYLVKMKNN